MWFQKKPSLVFGDDNNSMPGVIESTIASPIAEQIQGRKLHLRETLKRNKLYFRGVSKLSFSSCDLYFDNSVSVQKLIGKKEIDECSDFFKQWFAKSNIRFKNHLLPEGASVWNNKAWNKWFESTENKSEKVSIIISDFAGELPSGKFWESIAAHSYPIVVWLRHPYPNYKENELLLDIENQKKINQWKKNEFDENFTHWENGIRSFFLQFPGENKEIKNDYLDQLMLFILKYLTS
jgi:hypothetical protein